MRYTYFLASMITLTFWYLCVASAQIMSAENRYQILLQQYNIYLEYQQANDEEERLFHQAQVYAQNGDYEQALLYLEEALSNLKNSSNNLDSAPVKAVSNPDYYGEKPSQLNFSFISGIDFNRQEFEIGYIQDDSTVLEEVNKPYVGVLGQYLNPYGENNFVEITNSLRYDQENWRNDFRARWQASRVLSINYANFWSKTQESGYYSFWENELNIKVNDGFDNNFSWTVQDYFNYKYYDEENSYLHDYYRNRFNILLEWYTLSNISFFSEYLNELNESLASENLDYLQHGLRLGYRKDQFYTISHSVIVDAILRDYALEMGDSTINNTYRQVGLEGYLEIPLVAKFKFEIDENFIFKTYNLKSSLEPDYFWNLLRPRLFYELSTEFELGLGYEWEMKEHTSEMGDEYDVSEQDYKANGIFTSLNYYNANGMYLSLSISYQKRRYPNSVINDLISIYSNRNILSIMLMAYVPITRHLRLNVFVTYDNDEDIDLDQQNNQSTIFSLEVEYQF